jgi:hypothetical protein
VVALQHRREPQPDPNVFYVYDGDTQTNLPELDVIFMEYRWSTWKNDRTHPDHRADRYEPDLDRQNEILKHYHGKVPIIVWDTDLKITPEFEQQWPEVIIADPAVDPVTLTRKRVSLPFWTDFQELMPAVEPYPIFGYVGNNYERDREFQKFYFNVSPHARMMGVQVSMYGNWLQRSPERSSPESLISSYKDVAFNHRMGFYDSMAVMNKFIGTVHVSKQRYYETGFVSPRYFEALAVNCPALVPAPFKLGPILGKRWTVSRTDDVRTLLIELKRMNLEQRQAIIQEQRAALKELRKFDVNSVVDFIESVA